MTARAIIAIVVVVAGLSLASPASAAMLTILNNSFESPALAPNTAQPYVAITSWSTRGGRFGGAGLVHETFGATPLTPAGVQWALCNVDTDADEGGFGTTTGNDGYPDSDLYLWQNVGAAAYAEYTIDYLMGQRNNTGVKPKELRVSLWAGGTNPFPGEGAVLLDEHVVAAIPAQNTIASGSSTLLADNLGAVGQTLWLRFQIVADPANNPSGISGLSQMILDDINGTYELIPEPASLTLLALGGLLLTRPRRAA